MIKTQICCQVSSHEAQNLHTICIYDKCDRPFKGLCDSCILENLHDHKQQNQIHLMKQEQFMKFILKFSQSNIIYLSQQIQEIQHQMNELQLIIESILVFYKNLNSIRQDGDTKYLIQELYLIYEKSKIQIYQFQQVPQKLQLLMNNAKEIQSVIDQINMDYKNVLNVWINEIINKLQLTRQYQSRVLLEEIRQTFNNIEKIMENQQYLIQNKKQLQLISKNIQYENYLNLKYQSIYSQETQQISPDEKYLIINDSQILRVIKLRDKNKFTNVFLQIKTYLTICQFSNDSKLLICGSVGCLIVYSVIQGFKQIQKIQTDHRVCFFKIINKLLISCSLNGTMMVFDFAQKIKLFEIGERYIISLEYTEQNNIFISCSNNCQINFYDGKHGDLLFKQETKYRIYYLQLIKKKNTLITCEDRQLELWKIYDNKLQSLKQVKSQFEYYNVSLVHDETKLIMITEKNIIVFDNELNQLTITEFQIDLIDQGFFIKKNIKSREFSHNKQPNSMKYIIINHTNCTHILKLK